MSAKILQTLPALQEIPSAVSVRCSMMSASDGGGFLLWIDDVTIRFPGADPEDTIECRGPYNGSTSVEIVGIIAELDGSTMPIYFGTESKEGRLVLWAPEGDEFSPRSDGTISLTLFRPVDWPRYDAAWQSDPFGDNAEPEDLDAVLAALPTFTVVLDLNNPSHGFFINPEQPFRLLPA